MHRIGLTNNLRPPVQKLCSAWPEFKVVPRLVQNKNAQSLAANHFPLSIALAPVKICRHNRPTALFTQCFEPLHVRCVVWKFVPKCNDLRERFSVELVGTELIQSFSPNGRQIVIKQEVQAACRNCSSNRTAACTLRTGTSKTRATMLSAVWSPPSTL